MNDYAKYLKSMPVVPDVATKILSIAEDKLEISFRELEDTIKVDPGLSTKILKVANSALYARQKQVQNLQMAITLLGFKNIKSLVLLVTASNMFSKHKSSSFYQFFWKHSVLNAFMAKHMAHRTGNKPIADECFLAGLLHDIGQVALYNADTGKYARVLMLAGEQSIRISAVENDLYGTNHKEVGGKVLREWNFPELYVAAAEEHGTANITSSNKKAVLLISIADFLTSNTDIYAKHPLDVGLMEDIVRQTSMNGEDVDYYQNSFIEDVREDPLFNECRALFQIKQ